ncbi:OmpA family protein [Paraburkholderia phymatum]|uniref:OmpA/MotB domain protein n=1 Tax=Paraburkholderia phymatum (strain DSM 17167 / CIP 108236 / LMG 21445 / STM815) TaxID=391038 RepID=B2JIP9_PARP8|nr:OmpA family protein [Paraburkholderia phymatum]ACC72095.1 OmpA/MotB domain protein [Paraburkholderia phymatum STM815]
MSVDVIQLVRAALPEAVVRQLSNCLGLPSEATAKVMDVTTPALVAGLLHKCATLDGARTLFASVLGQEVNADIAEQLPRIFASTTGVTQLSSTGRHLLEHLFERRIDGLSDTVSMQTGVPAHATHAVTGIAGGILMGVLKRYLLDHQGNIGQLPTLLGQQLPHIAPFLNDGLTTVLGLGAAAAFAQTIGSPVRAVSSHFDHPAAEPASGRGPVEPTLSAKAPAVAQPAREAREVRHAGLKAQQWLGVAALSALIGALAAMLTWIALAYCPSATDFLGRHAVAAGSAVADAPGMTQAAAEPTPSQTARADAASVSGKVETDAAPTLAKDSTFIVSVDKSGKPTITATVRNVAERAELLNALTRKFGAGNFNADITIDESRNAADWLPHLDALMPLLATPGAEMKIDGTRVELSGAAADAKAGWLDRLQSLFGAPYQVRVFDPAQAVADAAQSFRNAARSLLAPGASCATTDLLKTLNLQVVNFASSDAHVPQSAFDDLGQSAKLLQACAKSGHALKLEVAGYSDNVGSESANRELSKERADAVRAFLVKAGVPADALIARGYGNVRAVASNATESGRFANRRIEFTDAQAQ